MCWTHRGHSMSLDFLQVAAVGSGTSEAPSSPSSPGPARAGPTSGADRSRGHRRRPHLHPGIENVEECEGVPLITLQGPPRCHTLWVALGAAGEGRLDAEGGRDGEHRLRQVERAAQDQHLPWGGTGMSAPCPPPCTLSTEGLRAMLCAFPPPDLGQGLSFPICRLETTTVPASSGMWWALLVMAATVSKATACLLSTSSPAPPAPLPALLALFSFPTLLFDLPR